MEKTQSLKAGKKVVSNSLWGIGSNILQNVFLGLFFVIIARQYSKADFADYIVANNAYQLVAAFSTMGLGQWFTREMVNAKSREATVNTFLKLQLILGVVFYVVNMIFVFAMYKDPLIRSISVYVGINILFDNIIYALKSLNVAEHKQKKNFQILLIEASLKLLLGVVLIFQSFSIVYLSVFAIVFRFLTLNLFLRIGASNLVSLTGLIRQRITRSDFKNIVFANWAFIVIGSISVVYWSIGKLIISKTLSDADIANYEIAFKLFSISQIIPVIISTTVFPILVTYFKNNDIPGFRRFYQNVFFIYFLFGLVTYTFIYSFADILLPFAFGAKYGGTTEPTQMMFLTILLFPTALLQANVLVAMKLEKLDMILNLVSLVLNISISLIALQFVRSLTVINLSIFASFFVFHLLQDIILYRKGMTDSKHIFLFYSGSIVFISAYIALQPFVHPVVYFVLVWLLVGFFAIRYLQKHMDPDLLPWKKKAATAR
ncbi:lipopolysaccharide biosynthesis protein [Flavihumibacter petaseus]|uniref:Putative polysaccharide export protein n=1 Tax=Flavihumibacter petaseus NBRC 106054 TaxID=1220578 RepID=A0A0E9N3E5_9BACT|nr:oligosaccharide flippase family protein [Flavihumibacter petaseus]GAO44323.1 putative polysaccharide export protein [Flavihumibacter petaseus NBRC 106054]